METYYSPSDAAAQLKIKPPTIRKYSLMMEEAGYTFHRDETGKRYYRDKDVMMIRKIITGKNNAPDLTLKQLVHSVVGATKNTDITVSDTKEDQGAQRYIDDMITLIKKQNSELVQVGEVKTLLETQNNQIGEIVELLKQQQEEINQLNEKINQKQEGFFSNFFKKK
ncbi:MerR family transcriptional regulator [Jeotgalibacillus terrae]|uniref:HTH merR-type domain-containing protein n=1 Tax=Jeotgalibacillus terrae TaxID=587735 RepID=A0ABW5ZQM9_9BACL|nr:hypothetical protein [Jeotgalibacillus terrae]MBM7581089.1 DNA-binding transcriptional MerR regulator [Jeotgalibacillus terrae]